MRFLSSSALAKADQLILAASCSAADAMVLSERRPSVERSCVQMQRSQPAYRRGGKAPIIWSASAPTPPRSTGGVQGAAGAGASRRVFRLPPALSIAAAALFEAVATSKFAFAVSSPEPRIFTPSRG